MRKRIAFLTILALVAVMLPVNIGGTVAQAASTSFTEIGTITENTADGATTTTLKTSSGKEIKFVVYDNGDFDYVEGDSYWSYRLEPLTGVIAIISKVNGNVRNETGYRQANGEIITENYGIVVEKHRYTSNSWSVTKNNEWTGAFVGSITKTLVKGSSMVSTETSGDIIDVFPNIALPAATTAPAATTNPTATTAPTATTTPTTAPTTSPTATPTTTPSASPSASPSVSPSASPSASPEVSPSAAPEETSVTTATPTPTAKAKVSNFTSLKHKTKIEKKAYKSLKSIEKLAKKHGWTVKRSYKRISSSKKKVVTKVTLKSKKWSWTFKHIVKKSKKKYKVSYYQTGVGELSASGVKGLIKNPKKYYK